MFIFATVYVNGGDKEQQKAAGTRCKYDKIMSYDLFLTYIDHITNKIENKIAGCLLDFRGMLTTIYLHDRYKDQRNLAGIRSKYDKIIIHNLHTYMDYITSKVKYRTKYQTAYQTLKECLR